MYINYQLINTPAYLRIHYQLMIITGYVVVVYICSTFNSYIVVTWARVYILPDMHICTPEFLRAAGRRDEGVHIRQNSGYRRHSYICH